MTPSVAAAVALEGAKAARNYRAGGSMAKGLWLDRRISRYLGFWRHQTEMKVRQRQKERIRVGRHQSWVSNEWIEWHAGVHWLEKRSRNKIIINSRKSNQGKTRASSSAQQLSWHRLASTLHSSWQISSNDVPSMPRDGRPGHLDPRRDCCFGSYFRRQLQPAKEQINMHDVLAQLHCWLLYVCSIKRCLRLSTIRYVDVAARCALSVYAL